MKASDFLAINEKLKKTNEDDTPFLITKEDAMKQVVSIIGDANKTEVKKNNYSIKFRMPKDNFIEKPSGAIAVGPFYIIEVEYDGVTITPRSDLKILDSIMKILPFFKRLKEDGDIEDFTKEEILSLYIEAGDQLHLAVYNLVAVFLGISDEHGQYMLPFSVITALNQIIDTHPEVFNEADVFFG